MAGPVAAAAKERGKWPLARLRLVASSWPGRVINRRRSVTTLAGAGYLTWATGGLTPGRPRGVPQGRDAGCDCWTEAGKNEGISGGG